ncbi:MAG: protein translocase subunit SecF [Bryobacterales bacterium]|nr:protein translocase subunit SecF [Bryobacteraceae bacterium]MDW8353268.1 protein translocase subunit SecF [Bryobacterales bacterium]
MELFKNPNFDFLGHKRPFLALSLVLIVASVASLVLKGGPRYGIDFRGGAVMYVRFLNQPPIQQIRAALSARIPGSITVQELTGTDEVIIGTELRSEKELDQARHLMSRTLHETFGGAGRGLDFNNVGQEALVSHLRDPLQRAGVALSEDDLQKLVRSMLEFRDTPPRSGLIRSFDELRAVPGVTPAVVSVLKQECWLAPFSIRRVEIVGPKVGADLRRQAILATLYALGGMLVYIAFRFEWIYGVAAVLAVFHDVLITVGLFSIFDKEIDLTVVAALLTLVGYSMNDTIVVFDRIRENLKILRREKFPALVNLSINQTLNRTVLTSGLTFLTCLALFLFGGPVLHGFAFALVVGILVGTYSSVFIASPILIYWHGLAESRKRVTSVAVATGREVRRVK